MAILVDYRIDKELYYNPDTAHHVTLITTEYTYKRELLVHLQISRNLGIRINNLIGYEFNKGVDFQNEQFLFKKTYSKGNAKPTTRGTFEEKLKRFDMSQTVTEQEIFEEYHYTDTNGKPDTVQIAVTAKSDSMYAVIDFKDAEQYENFIEPAWLTKPLQ